MLNNTCAMYFFLFALFGMAETRAFIMLFVMVGCLVVSFLFLMSFLVFYILLSVFVPPFFCFSPAPCCQPCPRWFSPVSSAPSSRCVSQCSVIVTSAWLTGRLCLSCFFLLQGLEVSLFVCLCFEKSSVLCFALFSP